MEAGRKVPELATGTECERSDAVHLEKQVRREEENRRLKQLVAELSLDREALQDVALMIASVSAGLQAAGDGSQQLHAIAPSKAGATWSTSSKKPAREHSETEDPCSGTVVVS
jgi:hypothetical protein